MIAMREKASVIHLHSTKAGMLGRLVSLILGIPCVYTVQDWGWRGLSPRNSRIVKFIEVLLGRYANCSYILVAGSLTAEAIESLN